RERIAEGSRAERPEHRGEAELDEDQPDGEEREERDRSEERQHRVPLLVGGAAPGAQAEQHPDAQEDEAREACRDATRQQKRPEQPCAFPQMLRQAIACCAQLRKLALIAIEVCAVRSAFRNACIASGWSVAPSRVRSGGGSAHGWSGITIEGPRVRNATPPSS